MSRASHAQLSEAPATRKAPVPAASSKKSLRIGPVHDSFEQEADRMARSIHSRPASAGRLDWSISRVGLEAPLQRKCSCGGDCEDCKKKQEALQRQPNGAAPSAIPRSVHQVLDSPGRSLDRGTRRFMESRFGRDFGHVRIHTGAAAAESAQDVAANAYTVSNKIVFNQGQYAPATESGRKLLAHELTHVVQQSGGGGMAASGPATEGEAARLGAQAGRMGDDDAPLAVRSSSAVGLARDPQAGAGQLIEVKFPDGVRQLTPEQFEAEKQRALRILRVDLEGVAALARNGRQTQESLMKEYHSAESLGDLWDNPKSLIGIAVDMKGGISPPYIGMWDHPRHAAEHGLAEIAKGNLRGATYELTVANMNLNDDMAEWNAYISATVDSGEKLINNLETVRDVSFGIALAAGAVVAAPVIAAGVAGLGATGATATVLTTAGTAAATGGFGATLGGGSTALGSYAATGKVDWKAVKHDAGKFGKQGVVTGLTVGLGTAIGGAGKAAELARPLVQQALRRCVTEAGINVAGEVTAEALDKITSEPKAAEQEGEAKPKSVLGPKARAALTGCVSGAIGVPVAKLGPVGQKVAGAATGAAVNYADARLSGQSNREALASTAVGVLTSEAVQAGHAGTQKAAAAKKASASTPHTPGTVAAEASQKKAKPTTAAPASASTPKPAPTASGPASTVKPAPSPSVPPVAADATHAPAPHSPTTPPHEKLLAQQKAVSHADTAPAILKEDALAKRPTADGHEAVVTPQGVGRCSPSPCPVIHVEYAKELAAHPELKLENDRIQALRKTDPAKAAEEGAALIRTLEAERHNAAPHPNRPAASATSAPASPDRSTTREQWKAAESKRRWGVAIDRAFAGDIPEHASTPAVTGGEASGYRIDDHRVPSKKQARLDIDPTPGSGDVAVPRRAGESGRDAAARVKTVIGTKISDHAPLEKLWNDAKSSVLSRRKLTSENYGELYDATRDAFWRRVNGNSSAAKQARALLDTAGLGSTSGKGAAQILGTDPGLKRGEITVSLDHIEEKAIGDNWQKALDARNLRFEFAMPNTNRENIQARHPELRQ